MRAFPFAVLSALLLTSACAGPPPSSAGPEDVLTRGSWRLEDLDGKGVIDDPMVTVTFAPDGRASGQGGCNRWFGAWKRDAAGLTLSQLGSTRMACAEALMHQENAFLSALQETTGWRIVGDGALLLTTRDGRTLTFRSTD